MSFSIRFRNIFYFITIALLMWFFYLERQILTPFILAMIFAYVFNPLINLFAKYLKFPRTISILLVYIIIIASTILITDFFARSLIKESENIRSNFNNFLSSMKKDVNTLPSWAIPYAKDYIDFFSKEQLSSKITTSPVPLFSRAFFGILQFFVFLFSAFFFLKDGGRAIEKLLLLFPNEYRVDVTILLKRINNVLSNYLRGQLVLIASMVLMLFVSFSVLGVKNALTISLFSALFEIVPIIGPIVATITGIFVIIISGGIVNFELNMLQTAAMVGIIYLTTRYIQDYVILPFVIGKVTKLHPLIILFSVIAGEHIYGILGVLLAVPIAATLKIVYEFIFDKIKEKDSKNHHAIDHV